MPMFKPLRQLAILAFALPFALASAAHADTIYNTTGGAENGGDPLSAAGPILADRIVSPTSAILSSVTLNLSSSGPAGQGFTVDLFADTGANGPGTVLLQIGNVLDSSLGSTFSLQTIMAGMGYQLNAGQSYYVGIMDNGGSNAILGNTLDPAVLSQADLVAGGSYYNNGGVQANSGGPYELSVATATTPEPGSLALVLTGGVAALGVMRRKLA